MNVDSKMQLYNDFGQYVFISRAWTKVRRSTINGEMRESGFHETVSQLGFQNCLSEIRK